MTHRSRNRLLLGGVMFIVAIVLFPRVIAKTGIRDRLIAAVIDNDEISVSTGAASLGYLTPVRVDDFRLTNQDESFKFSIDAIASSKSWPAMLWSTSDLGAFRFRRPQVNLLVDPATRKEDNSAEAGTDDSPAKPIPSLTAQIKSAGFRVWSDKLTDPVVDLSDLDFEIAVTNPDTHSRVTIEPVTLLDDELLTPQLCGQGLQLIAPVLADVIEVSGRISFRLDRCVIPVGLADADRRAKATEIEGRIELAQVAVGLNDRITSQLVGLLRRITKFDRPPRMSISESSAVSFHVTGGRVHHEGLMLLLPVAESALQIRSSGSVGVDETLDLQMIVGLAGTTLGDSALGRLLTAESLTVSVGGTIDDPQLTIDSSGGLLGRLRTVFDTDRGNTDRGNTAAGEDSDDGEQGELAVEALLEVVDGLRERAEQRDGPLLPRIRTSDGVLDRIRRRRESEPSPRRILPRRRRFDSP